MSSYKDRYQALKDEGICVYCKHREAIPGKVACGACEELMIERTNERWANRIKRGECPHCGGELEPGFKTCLVYRQRRREREKKYRMRDKVRDNSQDAKHRSSNDKFLA